MNSNAKGKRREREAAKVINTVTGVDARRGVQYQGGEDSPDIVAIPGIHFEVKGVEKLNITSAMQQSINDAGKENLPVVMHKRNRHPWMITLLANDLVDFSKAVLASLGRD